MRVAFLLFLLVAVVVAEERIVMLLDASGSMSGQEHAVVDGVNQLLSHLAASLPKDALISVAAFKFSDTSRKLLFEAPLDLVTELDVVDYRVGGGTPLFDVLGETLDTIRDNSTIVIATDGEDTTSTRYTRPQIMDKIEVAKTQRDIHFIFVAAGPEAFQGGASIGLGGGPGVVGLQGDPGDVGSVLTSATFLSAVSATALRHVPLQLQDDGEL